MHWIAAWNNNLMHKCSVSCIYELAATSEPSGRHEAGKSATMVAGRISRDLG
jgi:hypothetical protein